MLKLYINDEFIFIGISSKEDSNLKVSRTQIKAVEFIKDVFPEKKVIGLDGYDIKIVKQEIIK